jgi:hypothetical protein
LLATNARSTSAAALSGSWETLLILRAGVHCHSSARSHEKPRLMRICWHQTRDVGHPGLRPGAGRPHFCGSVLVFPLAGRSVRLTSSLCFFVQYFAMLVGGVVAYRNDWLVPCRRRLEGWRWGPSARF